MMTFRDGCKNSPVVFVSLLKNLRTSTLAKLLVLSMFANTAT